MNAFADNLKRLRKQKKLSQRQLAKELGVSASIIALYESGKRNPGFEALEALCACLGTRMSDLLENEAEVTREENPDLMRLETCRRVPLVGAIACGEPLFAPSVCEAVEAEAGLSCDCAMYCKGDSMIGARIYDGDLVFIRRQDTVSDGEIAAVAIDDEMTLKRVYKLRDIDEEGNVVYRLELRAENPRYAPIRIGGSTETRNVDIIGRAVAVRFKL